jgi:ethanolamine utilization protein EutA
LEGLCDLSVGDAATEESLQPVAGMLTQALEMAAGLRPPTQLLEKLRTRELGTETGCAVRDAVISFSGGVADCIETRHPAFAFGDIGPILGQAIRNSRLCQGAYRLGAETIRATVIGAGCHSAQLSGSTVFCQNMTLPFKNRPVVAVSKGELTPEKIRQKLAGQDTLSVLALPELDMPNYAAVKNLAAAIAQAMPSPIIVAMEQDMAKALGQAIALCRPDGEEILCIDRVRLRNGEYLDVGKPIGPALPVVVKTLILEQ